MHSRANRCWRSSKEAGRPPAHANPVRHLPLCWRTVSSTLPHRRHLAPPMSRPPRRRLATVTPPFRRKGDLRRQAISLMNDSMLPVRRNRRNPKKTNSQEPSKCLITPLKRQPRSDGCAFQGATVTSQKPKDVHKRKISPAKRPYSNGESPIAHEREKLPHLRHAFPRYGRQSPSST